MSDILRQVEESYEEHVELVSTNDILKKKKMNLLQIYLVQMMPHWMLQMNLLLKQLH